MHTKPDSIFFQKKQRYQTLRDNIGLNTSTSSLRLLALLGATAYTPVKSVAIELALQYARVRSNVAVLELGKSALPESHPVSGWSDFCAALAGWSASHGHLGEFGFWDLLTLLHWQKRTCQLKTQNTAGQKIELDLIQGRVVGLKTSERIFEKNLIKNLVRQGIASVITLKLWFGDNQLDPYGMLTSIKNSAGLDAKSFRLLYESTLRESLIALSKQDLSEFALSSGAQIQSDIQHEIKNQVLDGRNLITPEGMILKAFGACVQTQGRVMVYPRGEATGPEESLQALLINLMPILMNRHDLILVTLPDNPKSIHPALWRLIENTVTVVPDITSDLKSLDTFWSGLAKHTRVLGSVIVGQVA